MVNILEAQQQENKELLNEIETLKKQLTDKDKAISELKERFGVNENNILTEEEIRELIGSLNRNPDESHIRAVIDYFWLRPHELQHLGDKEFRKSFVRRIYMHHNAMSWWVKADKEVKSLQIEKNELTEKNKQLEKKTAILEKNIVDLEVKQKDLERAVELEQKNHLEFVDVSEEWHERRVFEMNMIKDGFITDLRLKVQELEKVLVAKDEKLVELTKLIEPKPKKFQRIRKLVNTTKEKAHVFKEKVQEKFHAYILQKNK